MLVDVSWRARRWVSEIDINSGSVYGTLGLVSKVSALEQISFASV